MTNKRVLFIRSGETDWNRESRWQGWVAAPLNAHGRRQVQALAGFLRNIGIGALYSSDLKRAVETSTILGERMGLTPVYDGRLRERNIGLWQGLTQDEMRLWYPDEFARVTSDPDNYRVPLGESRREARERMLGAFNDIVAKEQAAVIAIVSHTTAIKTLMGVLLSADDARQLTLENTSVTTLTGDPASGWRLVAGDDVMHLEGLDARAFLELEDSQEQASGDGVTG